MALEQLDQSTWAFQIFIDVAKASTKQLGEFAFSARLVPIVLCGHFSWIPEVDVAPSGFLPDLGSLGRALLSSGIPGHLDQAVEMSEGSPGPLKENHLESILCNSKNFFGTYYILFGYRKQGLNQGSQTQVPAGARQAA